MMNEVMLSSGPVVTRFHSGRLKYRLGTYSSGRVGVGLSVETLLVLMLANCAAPLTASKFAATPLLAAIAARSTSSKASSPNFSRRTAASWSP